MTQDQTLTSTSPDVSKAQRAYQWLKQKIAEQEFTPGYRLVLSTIAQRLDMSVVPVREAIRRLEAEGLVTFRRNVGAQVATAIASSRTSRDDNGLSTNIHNCPQGGFQMSPILHHLCEKFSTGGDG